MNKLEVVEGETSKTESLQEVEEGDTSRTESLSSKVSIGEPTGSEIDVATPTDLEIKLKVDEGETSKTEGGFTTQSVGGAASVLKEETSGQRTGGKDTTWVNSLCQGSWTAWQGANLRRQLVA